MIKAPHIYYGKDNLMVESITVEEIINEVGTPLIYTVKVVLSKN